MIKVTVGNNTTRKNVIVSEDATLRAVLEENGVDYTIGTTMIDGSSLRGGDLDKTFADFNVAEKCFLLNVVKTDNAACIKVIGTTAVLESGTNLEDIALLQKYDPEALKLYVGEGKEKECEFAVCINANGYGNVNDYGVEFGPVPNAAGKAIATGLATHADVDMKELVKEEFGPAVLKLNELEATWPAAIASVHAKKAAIEQCVQML